jgi:tRNA pseudouridine38/39 synthase
MTSVDHLDVDNDTHHHAAAHVQVRCIAAVLLMVGRGQEHPAIVQQLLDVSRFPSKPQYSLAAEEPLLLFACGFEGIQWQRTEGGLSRCLAVVGSQLQRHLVAAALTSSIFEQLQQERARLAGQQQQQQPQQQLAGESERTAEEQGQLQNGVKQHPSVEAAAAATGDGGKAGESRGLGAAGAARWLAAKPPHIAMQKRATEPSIEERFMKAGIPLELLNQRGLPASMQE